MPIRPILQPLCRLFNGIRKNKIEEKLNIFSAPPVFIVVCNNTSVSKEVYKYIAGYEYEDKNENIVVTGQYDLFSNYDDNTKIAKKRPPRQSGGGPVLPWSPTSPSATGPAS